MWKASTTSTILAVIIASLARSCNGGGCGFCDNTGIKHDARDLIIDIALERGEDIVTCEEFAAWVNSDYIDDDICLVAYLRQLICCPENMNHRDWDNGLFRSSISSGESYIAAMIMMTIILTTFAVLLYPLYKDDVIDFTQLLRGMTWNDVARRLSSHKEYHRQCARESFDEALFKSHPPKEDCAICCLPMMMTGGDYGAAFWNSCCGNNICVGCIGDNMTRLNSARLDPPCPFCRTPAPFSDKECIDRMKKRIELNDPEAFQQMGAAVHGGVFGLKQDHTKAAEMLLKAVELGSVRASNSLGDIYCHAEGVKKDLKKARYYFEQAAMGGSEEARYNLARLESGVGNMKRAVKHLMLGAEAGSDWCVEKIKDYFLTGVCTKEEYALAIRAHGACRDEMRSDSRDAAAKMVDELSRNNIKSREDLKRLGAWPASPALGAWPASPASQMKKRKHKKRAK